MLFEIYFSYKILRVYLKFPTNMKGPHLRAASFKVDMSAVHIHDVIVYDSGMVSPCAGLRKSGLTGHLPYMLDI